MLCNLGLDEVARAALGDLGVDLDRLRSAEPDAALGNGGLGRLAACFMESMATLGIPAYGYGIRYDHGLFRQVISDGWQQEYPGGLAVVRQSVGVRAAGGDVRRLFRRRVETDQRRRTARARPSGIRTRPSMAVAYDTPIVGWRGRHVNPLRLWSARAADPAAPRAFNSGDHIGALVEQARARGDLASPLSERRHARGPGTAAAAGIFLHLGVAAGPRAPASAHRWRSRISLPLQAAIQLNDTHPSIAVAELMRLLVDEHGLPGSEAWRITVRTLTYTNHTLLPEALETWPVRLFERLLPRHLQIIYRINAEHLEHAKQQDPAVATDGLPAIVSLIDETATGACAWAISPSSARTGSTASRRCTPS